MRVVDKAAIAGLVDEQRVHNAALERAGQFVPAPGALAPELIRRNRIEGRGGLPRPARLPAGVDRTIPGPAGAIPIRVFLPPVVRAVYVHFHGGGWVFGSIWEQDTRLWSIATTAEVAVVTVGYRLAPEHPLPAAIADAEAAVEWVTTNGHREFGTSRIILGAESAGAHIGASALVGLRDRHGSAEAVTAAQFSYGIYDLGMTSSQQRWGTRWLGISTPWLEWFYDMAVPGLTLEQRRHPDLSPLYGNLASLPAALFTVGTADPLLDDTILMADAWAAAGNDAALAVYPEGPHGINAMPTAMGALANNHIEAFIKGHAMASTAAVGP